MEDFIANIALTSFICGLAFVGMGLVMYYYPPKNINDLYGYRTGSSKKSQDRWDFAQRFCAVQAMKIATLMIVLSLLVFFIPIDVAVKQFSGIFMVLICTAYLLYSTEAAIKKRFNKS